MRGPDPAEGAAGRPKSDQERLRPDEQLARWARRQHRQVTTAQLRAVGWDKHAVEYRVRSGRLHPVYENVFSLGGRPQSDRELWMAATLSFGKGTKLGHAAAAELYELVRFPLHDIHVVTLRKRRPREGITPHHRSEGVPWQFVDHIPVTSPEQTILDCASSIRSDKLYRRIVRQAQADRLTSHAKLVAFAALNPGQRGVARMKRELAAGPSPTRSGFEDEVLEIFRTGGEPLPNHVIDGDEVDLYWPKLRIAVEVDGPVHDNPAARAHDEAKRRRLQSRGVRVLRVS